MRTHPTTLVHKFNKFIDEHNCLCYNRLYGYKPTICFILHYDINSHVVGIVIIPIAISIVTALVVLLLLAIAVVCCQCCCASMLIVLLMSSLDSLSILKQSWLNDC